MSNSDVPFLRVPERHQAPADVFATASKLNIDHVIVLAETEDGFIFLSNELTSAQANWLLDRAKLLLLRPEDHNRLPR